jgi:hypothetical protein
MITLFTRIANYIPLPLVAGFEPLNLGLLVDYSAICATTVARISNFVCSITFLTKIASHEHYAPRGSWIQTLKLGMAA